MLQPRFITLLYAALREFALHGYTTEARLQDWLLRLHHALEYELPTDAYTRKQLAGALNTVFKRSVSTAGIQRRVPGVGLYTLDMVAPALRAELDRRIFAGVDLIRLNRAAAVQKTLQRFSGWASSVPPDGLRNAKVRDIAGEIAKPVRQVRYEARRVAIDQGAKLQSAVAHVVAKQEGAVAAIWHDRGEHDHSYDARKAHLARSGKLFLIRDSWAMEEGLIRRGALDYTDSIEQPAELPFCSCWYEYATSPRDLPETVLTAKGRAAV